MSTAVLIASCNAFADVWPAALACLDKYWPDCPWPVYTSSGTKPWGKNPILTGELPWVPAMKVALAEIQKQGHEIVLAWLDDMLLCRSVDTPRCQLAANYLWMHQGIGAVRLGQGNEKCTGGFVDGTLDFLKPIAIDSDYRISTSPTLWQIPYLLKILDNCGETAWEFESKGTEFSRTLPEPIATTRDADDTTRPIRQYYTGITRGKWNRGCLNWLRNTEGIVVADTSRGIIENEREP